MKTDLRGLRCYLAGNIEAVSNREATEWRVAARQHLEKLGVEVFDPLQKPSWVRANEGETEKQHLIELRRRGQWTEFKRKMSEVRRADLRAVNHADFIIAGLAYDKFSVGTIEEIVTATREGKLVFVVIDQELPDINPWLIDMVGVEYITRTFEKVFERLENISETEARQYMLGPLYSGAR